MAVGECVLGQSEIANNAYFTIQPTSTQQYMVVNVWSDGDFELYMTDGSNEVKVNEVLSSPYSLNLYKYLVSNTNYATVKNISGTTASVGFSGIQVK